MFINVQKEIFLAILLLLGSMLTAKIQANTINLKEFVITAEAPSVNESNVLAVTATDYYGTTFKSNDLNFDLQPLPVGQYTIRVIKNGEEVNAVYLNSLQDDKTIITVEALDADGNQVYESTKSTEMFDLEQMPLGTYTINIYQGKELVNTQTVNKA